jgi:tetratricopeptide (TPR) repeat protein
VIIYKIATITTKTIIVFFAFLILYSYLPIANRIYILLLNSEIFNGPGNIDSFGTFGYPTSSDDTPRIIWGILTTLFTFVIPPGLIFLLAWRVMKKVNFHRKKIYKSIGDRRESSIEGLMDGKKINSISNNTSLSIKEWLEKGEVLYTSGSYQEAINSYTNAINLSPNYKAYFNRGVVHSKLGNRKQTVSDLKAAARLGHKKSQKILSSKGIAW